jgi:hypothetical protein
MMASVAVGYSRIGPRSLQLVRRLLQGAIGVGRSGSADEQAVNMVTIMA